MDALRETLHGIRGLVVLIRLFGGKVLEAVDVRDSVMFTCCSFTFNR